MPSHPMQHGAHERVVLRLGRAPSRTWYLPLGIYWYLLTVPQHEFVKFEVGKDMLDQLAADEAAVA